MTQELRKIEIRKATEADYHAIADLLNQSFEEIERSYIEEDPETADSAAGDGPFFVAIDEQARVVGCVKVSKKLGAILKLAVKKSLRQQGIGRRLMAKAENYMKSLGLQVALTGFMSFRTDLPPFYRALGYKETGHKRTPPGPPSSYYLVEMSKSLV
jgi:N-acetylglutamate synthase-like GNAT family acetyltransferase